jgi:phosphate transport system substrate-binding protein
LKKLFITLLILLFGCSANSEYNPNIIRIKGSDTMLLLNKKLAEEFMIKFPGISVYVEGDGSDTGIKALINNSVEICSASRPLEAEEIKEFGEKHGSVGMSYFIGRDALSIYINLKNPINSLTIEQIADIFTCKIKNWKEVGGEDFKINPISRSNASGTYLYFIKHVLKGEGICPTILTTNTTRDIIDYIRKDVYAIGYGGIGYGDSIIHCNVNGIEPNKENVVNNSYPISRYLRYYTLQKTQGNVKKFIDWVTSEEGQLIVEEAGYFALWKN